MRVPDRVDRIMVKRMSFFWVGIVILLAVGCRGGGIKLSSLGVSQEQLRQRMRQVIFEAAGSEDAALRSHAMESLGALGGLEAPGLIRKGLHDPVAAVRFAAAGAAGDLKDYTARHLLERLLWDKEESVKLAAAYGLEKLGDDRFGDWYDAVLMGDDARLAAQACILLGKLGRTEFRPDSEEKLWRVLRKVDQAPSVKLQAAEALARLGDERITRKLLAYAGSGYADDRLIAISGLEQLGGQEAWAMLTVLADDSQVEVRLGAIRALGEQASEEDLVLLHGAINHVDTQGDENATVRVRGLASLALGRVGQDSDAGLLYGAMGSEWVYVRVAAARGAIDFLRRRGNL